ncbi:gamma-mobile-trio protein GmtX [Vreelandella venusta]|uniref:gamma-mobile-trio protein GmtX n=1 Tax=Vreelandella venusta TaxID=44935 RepID=UPI00200C225D|nr:gamma-mobile-trio protein GmtX [Halomonas venusta]MDW0359836.1 gamma-mobile-trio protein GmtX [Halomonas venusta]UQI39255.1 gamma-mobile-trio protein GmtX [Halomonas venusta]
MENKDFLLKLKKDATPRTKKTLDAIYEVCIDQMERGANDFSIITISRLGAKRGVPKPQSIRNKSGEKYRALIDSFSNMASGDVNRSSPSGDDWIEEIANARHKLLVRSLLSELKNAKSKLNEIIPPGTRIDVYDHRSQKTSEEERLSQQERRAMEYLISNEFFGKWNFCATEFGEVVDENGQVVFKAATIDAVKKSLNNL